MLWTLNPRFNPLANKAQVFDYLCNLDGTLFVYATFFLKKNSLSVQHKFKWMKKKKLKALINGLVTGFSFPTKKKIITIRTQN